MKRNSYRTGTGTEHRRSEIYGRSNGSLYIDGDVVRRVQPSYNDRPAQRQISDTTRRNRERASYMTVGYICFLTLMIGILGAGCIWYVNLRSEITASQKTISRMQVELSDLKMSNDEEYDRIIGSVDLEKIKKIAMDDLGMKYPDSDQVIGIDNEGSDYVRQYKDIPEK